MSSCKNCDHNIKSTDKFCPNCGQKNREKLTLKVLLGELASAYISWDSKLFRTLVPLLIRPGKVSSEYVSGKRMSFVAPLRLYLFCSVIFFLTLSLLGTSAKQDEESKSAFKMDFGDDIQEIGRDSLFLLVEHDQLDDLQSVQEIKNPFWRKMYKKAIIIGIESGSFNAYLRSNISVMLFIFIPVFGWVLKLFFLRKKLDYIQHLIYGLYFHSFLFLILWLTLILSRIIANGMPLVFGIVYLIIYLMVGMRNFYEIKWGTAIVKTFLISAVYILLFALFAASTIGLSIWVY